MNSNLKITQVGFCWQAVLAQSKLLFHEILILKLAYFSTELDNTSHEIELNN